MAYHRVDQEVEKAKGRRFALVWVGHILALAAFAIRLLPEIDIVRILSVILVCTMIGSTVFWIEYGVFSWMITHNRDDHNRRERIIERIQNVAAEEKRNT